jgi:hypothetical protein
MMLFLWRIAVVLGFDRYLPIRELRSASEISLPLRGLAAFRFVLQSL